MTGPGSEGGRTQGRGDGPEAVAHVVADAVDSLVNLWGLAVEDSTLRLSQHQLRALRTLQSAPGLNLTGLAEELDIGLPTASRLCDRLQAAGLLERSLHPEKRREVRLALTAQGQRTLGDVAARREQALAAVLADMSAAQRAALSEGLVAFLTARSNGEP
ncbi:MULTISPECIES: MarR family winged helix-turn-helix transcriptional regulator [unclassified Streptomyces]|uniref:MarR family winged helix-turn-helix transcriptional regulator n=1 Tax=unclassified Streptomyces TaxID=2593676 RepID=UPI003D7044BD